MKQKDLQNLFVQLKIWDAFLKFMYGQTTMTLDDGEIVYFMHDIENFLYFHYGKKELFWD